jgi:hypothetical protein
MHNLFNKLLTNRCGLKWLLKQSSGLYGNLNFCTCIHYELNSHGFALYRSGTHDYLNK